MTPGDVGAWSGVAQTLIGVVAALHVWYEYNAPKQARRADLAIGLAAQLRADELMAFAVTSLDWGGGFVIVPAGCASFSGRPCRRMRSRWRMRFKALASWYSRDVRAFGETLERRFPEES